MSALRLQALLVNATIFVALSSTHALAGNGLQSVGLDCIFQLRDRALISHSQAIEVEIQKRPQPEKYSPWVRLTSEAFQEETRAKLEWRRHLGSILDQMILTVNENGEQIIIYSMAAMNQLESESIYVNEVQSSDDPALLFELPPNTRVDRFLITPDGKKLVIAALSGFKWTKGPEKELALAENPLTPHVFVIDIKNQQLLNSLTIPINIEESETRNIVDGNRLQFFSLGAISSQYVFLGQISGYLRQMEDQEKLNFWLDLNEGKIIAQPLFPRKNRFSWFSSVRHSDKLFRLDANANFVVGTYSSRSDTPTIFSGRHAPKPLDGIFFRDLKNDPLGKKGDEAFIFTEEHLLSTFEEIKAGGTNPKYVFAPNGQEIYVMGNQGGLWVIENIKGGSPSIREITGLPENSVVRTIAFSEEGAEVFLSGFIDLQNRKPRADSLPFYMVLNSTDKSANFHPAFFADELNVEEALFLKGYPAVAAVDSDRRSIQILNTKYGRIEQKQFLTSSLSPSEFIVAIAESKASGELVVRTSFQRIIRIRVNEVKRRDAQVIDLNERRKDRR
jgi:hypothetical protein